MAERAVAVFGSAEPRPGDRGYDEAYRVGALLARAGYTVITGGYGGAMEGASHGARSASGRTVGIGCAIFEGRAPNPYLDEFHLSPDLFVRTRELIERAQGYIVLQGKAGTLAELSFLWALDRAGCLGRRPVVLLGGRWESLMRSLSAGGVLESSQLRLTRLASSPEEALSALEAGFPRGEE